MEGKVYVHSEDLSPLVMNCFVISSLKDGGTLSAGKISMVIYSVTVSNLSAIVTFTVNLPTRTLTEDRSSILIS